eukprot:3310058-Amphidinium_carterae.1
MAPCCTAFSESSSEDGDDIRETSASFRIMSVKFDLAQVSLNNMSLSYYRQTKVIHQSTKYV